MYLDRLIDIRKHDVQLYLCVLQVLSSIHYSSDILHSGIKAGTNCLRR